MTSTELDVAAEQRVSENYGLAIHISNRFCNRYEFLDREEADQLSLVALWKSAQDFPNANVTCKFSTYAGNAISWELIRLLKKALPDHHVRSLSEPAGENDRTVEDVAASYMVEQAESERIHSEREQSLLLDVHAAIASGVLTEREVKFLGEYIEVGATMESVAQKNNVTKMRASQIISDAAKKIRKRLGIALKPSQTAPREIPATTEIESSNLPASTI